MLCSLACGCRAETPAPTETPASATEDARPADEPQPDAAAPDGPAPLTMESGDACASGSLVVEDAAVCLRIPSGYAVARSSAGLRVFEHPDEAPITLRWTHGSPELRLEQEAAVKRLAGLDASATSGSTRDGAGAFVFASEIQPNARVVFHAASVTTTPDGTLVWCSGSTDDSDVGRRAVFEACQSLMARPG
ncbi:MAG: hypothetical protein AAGA54_33005 [Myxococcota bacterium]